MNPADSTYFCAASGDGSSSRPWTLVDRSASGARLMVDDPDRVPDRFALLQKGVVTTVWTCRVVWRSGSHIGVRFEDHHAISA
jgi:hypothetical protein